MDICPFSVDHRPARNTTEHPYTLIGLSTSGPDRRLASLALEGCDDMNGVFTAINSFSSAPAAPAVYKNLLRVMSMGSPDRLYTYLRWRVMPTNVNWRVTFRVNAVLK